jgi:hypothetical protein
MKICGKTAAAAEQKLREKYYDQSIAIYSRAGTASEFL